jgi:cysteine desulfurase
MAALVSIGLANGEVGTVQPVAEIATRLAGRGIVLHTDAAQACGRIPVDVRALGVDLLSLSSHKLGGPAGAGALWVRPGVDLVPTMTGGPQERGRRAGTENVAALVGFGAAARLANEGRTEETRRLRSLTNGLWEGLHARVGGLVRNGPANEACLPNTLNVTVTGCAGESLLVLLDLEGIAVSLGSACAAGSAEPSHVLLALGRDATVARSSVRLSLGHDTTAADVERVLEVFPRVVAEVRRRSAA